MGRKQLEGMDFCNIEWKELRWPVRNRVDQYLRCTWDGLEMLGLSPVDAAVATVLYILGLSADDAGVRLRPVAGADAR